MKIRKLADAAIVAALLLTSVPDLEQGLTPDALLMPAACTEPARNDVPDTLFDAPAAPVL